MQSERGWRPRLGAALQAWRGRTRLQAGLLMAASVAAGLCVGAALHAMARAPQPAANARLNGGPDCSVMLFGDSILYGAHNGLQRLSDPPAALLQRLRPRYEVMDHSHPGDSASLHAPRFKRTPLRARIVVLQFGINDAGQNTAYEPALRAMVRRVQAQGRIPVITGLSHVSDARPPEATDAPPRGAAVLAQRGSVGVEALSEGQPRRAAYNRIARRIAQSTGTVFADWGAVPFDSADMADAVHPGQPYANRLTQQLVRALDRVAPECAQPLPTQAALPMVALHRTGDVFDLAPAPTHAPTSAPHQWLQPLPIPSDIGDHHAGAGGRSTRSDRRQTSGEI